MYVGACGYIWGFMGVLGCTSINTQGNKTERDTNGITGYDFPQKDTYVHAVIKG